MIVDIGRATGEIGVPRPIQFEEQWQTLTLGSEEIAVQGPVTFQGVMTQYPDHVLVEGSIQATLQLVCGRCLSSYSYPEEMDISEEYALKTDDEHPDRYLYEGYTINLAPMVEDNILSRLPIARLCRQDCSGLCPVCGQKLNEQDCACHSQQEETLPAWKAVLKQHKEE